MQPRTARFLIVVYTLALFTNGFFAAELNKPLEAVETGLFNLGNISVASSIALATLIAAIALLASRIPPASPGQFLRSPGTLLASLLFGVQLVSAAYASLPIGSLYQSLPAVLSMMVAYAMFVHVAYAESSRQAFDELWHFAAWVQVGICGLVLLSVLAPVRGPGYDLTGGLVPIRLSGDWFFVHPNTLGMIALVAGFHFAMSAERRAATRFALAICATTFVLSQYRTGYVMLIAALCATFWFSRRHRLPLAIAAVALAGVILAMPSRAYDFIARGDDVESVRDMSGRVPLWEAGIEFGLQRPLLGYGAYSGIRLDFGWQHRDDFGYMETNNFDNSFMNVFIETGLVGVVLLVGLLGSLTRMSWRHASARRSTVDLEMFALVLAFLIKSYTGNVVTYFSMTQFYLAFLLVYGASRPLLGGIYATSQPRRFRRLVGDADMAQLS